MGVPKHTGDGHRRCPVCALSVESAATRLRFRSPQEIRRHLLTHGVGDDIRIRDETVTEENNRRRRSTTSVYACSKCHKLFANSSNLNRHAKTHLGGERVLDNRRASKSLDAKVGKENVELARAERKRAAAKKKAVSTPTTIESEHPIKDVVKVEPVDGPTTVDSEGLLKDDVKEEPTDSTTAIDSKDVIKDLVKKVVFKKERVASPKTATNKLPEDTEEASMQPSATSPPDPGDALASLGKPNFDSSSPFTWSKRFRKVAGVMPMSPLAASTPENVDKARPLWVECPQCCQRLNSSTTLWSHMKRVHGHRRHGLAAPGTG